ncbi:MAG: hypothetical protein KGZ61_06360 [Sandarakinorhabdus sp.]|nr:hypothetical protein [Sandarakinorhabdus sp.]
MAGADIEARPRWRRLRIAVWMGAALMLLLPAMAMQLTDAMNWGPGDFAVLGAMLLGAAGALELAARFSGSGAYLAAGGIAVGTAFLVIVVNLAVGIVGSEANPANLLFAGVLGVGIVGAFAARFRPRGMALALVAMAGAQILFAIIALLAGLGTIHGTIPVVTILLVTLWLASALLFRKAAQEGDRTGAA